MEFELMHKKLTIEKAKRLNPLSLAFIGDAVFEVIVRNYLIIHNTELTVHKLHVKAISYVKAHAQSESMKKIMELLTDEELTIYKRGRNTKTGTVPKNAELTDYRIATGFEALVGFLYITGQEKRLEELLEPIIESNN
jgi:ribonuclease III family protein